MTRIAATTLWSRLCRAWRQGEAPADPRLAAEAGLPPARPRRQISPLVGAWLR